MKRCSKCGEVKPYSEFVRDRGRPDGLFLWCKACHRDHQRKRIEANREYARRHEIARRRAFDAAKQAILTFQGGGCGICGDTKVRIYHLDHDPACRQHRRRQRDALKARHWCVRGVLCIHCNANVLRILETHRHRSLLLPGPAVERYLADPPAQAWFRAFPDQRQLSLADLAGWREPTMSKPWQSGSRRKWRRIRHRVLEPGDYH